MSLSGVIAPVVADPNRITRSGLQTKGVASAGR
jgi:hypothetical protein